MKSRLIIVQCLVISLMVNALIYLLIFPLFAAKADDLPPRGTPPVEPVATATPAPTAEPEQKEETESPPNDGARLQLHLMFSDNRVWDSLDWRSLWTEVEWTNGDNWYVVEGWRGKLDGIEQTEQGDWFGQREWWVSSKDLNTGPFRWVIYQQEGGDILTTSDSFNLPAQRGETTVVNETISQ